MASNSITQYSLLTPAVSPALALNEVKDHLKISGSDYDSQLLRLIQVVTQYAERATGRDLINKTWKGYLDHFPGHCFGPCTYCVCSTSITVRRSKLQSITSIQYYINGVLTNFPSTDYYFTDSSDFSQICLVDGKSWPNTDNRRQVVVITFISGYGEDDCSVPRLLKQAMLSQLTLLFENAGDCAEDSKQFESLYTSFIIASNFLRVI